MPLLPHFSIEWRVSLLLSNFYLLSVLCTHDTWMCANVDTKCSWWNIRMWSHDEPDTSEYRAEFYRFLNFAHLNLSRTFWLLAKKLDFFDMSSHRQWILIFQPKDSMASRFLLFRTITRSISIEWINAWLNDWLLGRIHTHRQITRVSFTGQI